MPVFILFLNTLCLLATHRLYVTNAQDSKELTFFFNLSICHYEAENQKPKYGIAV